MARRRRFAVGVVSLLLLILMAEPVMAEYRKVSVTETVYIPGDDGFDVLENI